MSYGKTKVYFDGSHYIAIPHTERPKKLSNPKKENSVTESQASTVNQKQVEFSPISIDDLLSEEKAKTQTKDKPQNKPKLSKKQLFDNLYKETLNLPKNRQIQAIMDGMKGLFKDEQSLSDFVMSNIERKHRNLVLRRIRLTRKVNLHEFNYFVTFTYSDEKHTEETFRKKLKNTLGHLSARKGWKYIGVWERSPEKKRLHFHGIFYIPQGTLPGVMVEVNSFSFSERKRQVTLQNDYFNNLFGRNDFRPIENKNSIGEAVAYIVKYIEKSGEKIVYSRGLPQFFISDIMDEDIVCPYGVEDKKLLLFDDFSCWDEGCYMGTVSKETISLMPKSN